MYINESKIMKKIFTIECKDIILREFMLEDLDKLYGLTLQKEITDLLPDWISTKEQRGKWLIEDIEENKEFLESVPNIGSQCLRLGIILKETNEFIGWCCSSIKDELSSSSREIAYAISKEYRGRGYTTQAAEGLIKYLFKETNTHELIAIALLRNIPSNRVMQKCGFKYVGIVDLGKEKFNYYKISREKNLGY